jgi:hypothetical protein
LFWSRFFFLSLVFLLGCSLQASKAGAEIAFRLPLSSTHLFPALFKSIEADRANTYAGFGISMTTLEEVFMRISASGLFLIVSPVLLDSFFFVSVVDQSLKVCLKVAL